MALIIKNLADQQFVDSTSDANSHTIHITAYQGAGTVRSVAVYVVRITAREIPEVEADIAKCLVPMINPSVENGDRYT